MSQGARTAIPGRHIGTIADWKGAHGFIQPSKPIKHPSAHKRGGKVYLAAEDVSEELDGIGAKVSFGLYSDSAGLGASDVKMATSAQQAQPKLNGGATKSNAVAAYKAANSPAAKAAAARSPQQPQFQKKSNSSQSGGKGGSKEGKGWYDGGKGGGKGGKKGGKSGKYGEGKRELLHDEPLLGVIVEWKGTWGWLKPNDTIDHPLADKHQGDLYIKQEDVEEEIEGIGAVVQYMLYQDKKGLGACEVRPAE